MDHVTELCRRRLLFRQKRRFNEKVSRQRYIPIHKPIRSDRFLPLSVLLTIKRSLAHPEKLCRIQRARRRCWGLLKNNVLGDSI